jgi:tRNA dimethylallyltransferase
LVILTNPFFIVGPTATGKSELAADLAASLGGEIVSADAFQIYRGFELLSAKPDPITLTKAPHHLVGVVEPTEDMNAEKFRQLALRVVSEIQSRGKLAIVVGGSGLYLKALTHGLSDLPPPDPKLRAELNSISLNELVQRLLALDPSAAGRIDLKNRRRVSRALEIALIGGNPGDSSRSGVDSAEAKGAGFRRDAAAGVFVFRDREDLYQRINRRVEEMFEHGVIDQVRRAKATGTTASQMIGLREIRLLLDGKMTEAKCVAAIQQATRRYAKRQLTWFRHQSNFPSLNLSLLTEQEALNWISQPARLATAHGND